MFSYVFTLNTLDKKYDHVISTALSDIQAYDSNFNKFNNFSLTFHFLTPKERDLHGSHDVMYELNKHTLTLTISSANINTLKTHQHNKFTTDINTLTLNTPHHSSLTSLIVLKILFYKASSEVMIS